MRKEQPTWEIVAVSRSPKKDTPLSKIPRVTMVKGDVEDIESVKELTKDVQLVFCTGKFGKVLSLCEGVYSSHDAFILTFLISHPNVL